MRRLLLLAFLAATPAFAPATSSAQTLYTLPLNSSSSSPVVDHIGGVPTCHAIVTGTNDKTVTWSVTSGPGTLYGTNPSVANEPAEIGVTSSTVNSVVVVTAKSNANNSVTGTCTFKFVASPAKATGNPKLFITASQIAAMRAKGLSSNTLYNSNIALLASSNYTSLTSMWTWSTWSGTACTGGTAPTTIPLTGEYEIAAYWFALAATFDNSSTNRNQYGCSGRDIFVSYLNYIQAGAFDLYHGTRWADNIDVWTYVYDLLKGGGYLSSADIALWRTVAYNSAQGSIINPQGVGVQAPIANGTTLVYNTTSMLNVVGVYAQSSNVRELGNNYVHARIMLLTAFALMFNDNTTDDPPLTNTCSATRYQVCPDGTAGSMHAYWTYIDGGMLYDDWAVYNDEGVVQQTYNAVYSNVPTQPQCTTQWGGTMDCYGIDRGGEAIEGANYGSSVVKLQNAMNIIHNAGYDDPLLYGPQISLATMSFWDMRFLADLTSIVTLNAAPALQIGSGGWSYLTDGDSNTNWTDPTNNATESGLLTYDTLTGRTDRAAALEWFIVSTAFGMGDGTATNPTSGINCHFYCGYVAELGGDFADMTGPDMFMDLPAGNPVTSLSADPRPNYPTDWFDAGNNHLVLRNNWGSTYTIFDYWATNTQVDHEHQFTGRFQIESNNEWITKGRMGFNDYNVWMTTGLYQNIVSIHNSTGSTYAPNFNPWGPNSLLGDFWHSYEAGITPFAYSNLPTYAATHVDSTNAYNGGFSGPPFPYNDVTAASRDMVYLRNAAQLVYYDRAAVGHSASTQGLYLVTTGAVTFTGNTGRWNTRSGTQSGTNTTLLPVGASLSSTGLTIGYTIGAPNLNLQNGTTMQATCSSQYADGTNQNCITFPDQTQGLVAQWSSSNNAVATVNATTGLITATGIGSATITAYYTYPLINQLSPANFTINVISGTSGGGAVSGSELFNQQGNNTDWEPSQQLAIKPAGTPTSAQYLNVLQWGTSSFTPATSTLVQSSSGQGYDGALVGSTLVMFMRSLATFTGVTYPASGGTTQYVADLTPNAAYSISGAGAPASASADNAGVLTFAATGTGNITVSPSGITAPPVGLSGTISLTGTGSLP